MTSPMALRRTIRMRGDDIVRHYSLPTVSFPIAVFTAAPSYSLNSPLRLSNLRCRLIAGARYNSGIDVFWGENMTYRGVVKNGVVVLGGTAELPEGTEVRVETIARGESFP